MTNAELDTKYRSLMAKMKWLQSPERTRELLIILDQNKLYKRNLRELKLYLRNESIYKEDILNIISCKESDYIDN